MIVAGLSGRIEWTDDEKQVEAIFKTLNGSAPPSTGDDAH
jgi:hypothetical protein